MPLQLCVLRQRNRGRFRRLSKEVERLRRVPHSVIEPEGAGLNGDRTVAEIEVVCHVMCWPVTQSSPGIKIEFKRETNKLKLVPVQAGDAKSPTDRSGQWISLELIECQGDQAE